ncbi:MAG TPA: STAS domain-containing protein [Mycobacteriales bacterium]
MSFAVESSSEQSAVRVTVTGEVDMDTAPRMRHAVERAVAGGEGPVLVDLGEVTFMDSSGLSALVASHQVAAAHSVPFRLLRVPARVLNLIQITGLDAILVIVPGSGDGLPVSKDT